MHMVSILKQRKVAMLREHTQMKGVTKKKLYFPGMYERILDTSVDWILLSSNLIIVIVIVK